MVCGRFVGFRRLEELVEHFPIDVANMDVTPNYNVAPTQEIHAITRSEEKNHLEKLHWGLVPFWAKDSSDSKKFTASMYLRNICHPTQFQSTSTFVQVSHDMATEKICKRQRHAFSSTVAFVRISKTFMQGG